MSFKLYIFMSADLTTLPTNLSSLFRPEFYSHTTRTKLILYVLICTMYLSVFSIPSVIAIVMVLQHNAHILLTSTIDVQYSSTIVADDSFVCLCFKLMWNSERLLLFACCCWFWVLLLLAFLKLFSIWQWILQLTFVWRTDNIKKLHSIIAAPVFKTTNHHCTYGYEI